MRLSKKVQIFVIILLVQDRAGWRHEVSPLGHRSQKVNLPLGIETEFLLPTDLECIRGRKWQCDAEDAT